MRVCRQCKAVQQQQLFVALVAVRYAKLLAGLWTAGLWRRGGFVVYDLTNTVGLAGSRVARQMHKQT
jgi:hypothetical protein